MVPGSSWPKLHHCIDQSVFNLKISVWVNGLEGRVSKKNGEHVAGDRVSNSISKALSFPQLFDPLSTSVPSVLCSPKHFVPPQPFWVLAVGSLPNDFNLWSHCYDSMTATDHKTYSEIVCLFVYTCSSSPLLPNATGTQFCPKWGPEKRIFEN